MGNWGRGLFIECQIWMGTGDATNVIAGWLLVVDAAGRIILGQVVLVSRFQQPHKAITNPFFTFPVFSVPQEL